MQAWRVCRAAFADLSGAGARLHGGRWNSPGRALLYTAENPALAILEVRVHLDLEPELVPDDYVLIELAIPDAVPLTLLNEPPDDTRRWGDEWLARAETAIAKVPSFIAPRSFNILINPAHRDAAAIMTVETRKFAFDMRLWLPLSPRSS